MFKKVVSLSCLIVNNASPALLKGKQRTVNNCTYDQMIQFILLLHASYDIIVLLFKSMEYKTI